jgi:23S rRNA (uracil1939-C5)-methyltransferase/tRNA (uracil-5-)-methyltransferase
VNPHVLPLLVDHVLQEARGHNCRHLIDAYCGSGLFSLSAAAHFLSVIGIEVSQMAVRAAEQNARDNHITNAKFVWGKAETLFMDAKNTEGVLAEETTVVIDPSRKGCDASFLAQLLDFAPRKIVYVSCNPATQARDVRTLCCSGYVITRVTPFDMFPQTKHVESVLTLQKMKRGC